MEGGGDGIGQAFAQGLIADLLTKAVALAEALNADSSIAHSSCTMDGRPGMEDGDGE